MKQIFGKIILVLTLFFWMTFFTQGDVVLAQTETPTPTVTVTPEPTLVPTDTPDEPTETPKPTVKEEPTPTKKATIKLTPTPSEPLTPTPTEEPTPTPTPTTVPSFVERSGGFLGYFLTLLGVGLFAFALFYQKKMKGKQS